MKENQGTVTLSFWPCPRVHLQIFHEPVIGFNSHLGRCITEFGAFWKYDQYQLTLKNHADETDEVRETRNR